MLQVSKDLCIGCAICERNCPQSAISVQAGKARINQERCRNCGVCLSACPKGAIMEIVPVSKEALTDTIGSLKQKAADLIDRIERLQ